MISSKVYVKANNILNATQRLEHLNYINALESDFPDYIDVTAEGDEYHRYYCR